MRKNNWDRSGLPGWTYQSDSLFQLESEELFRKHWQFVCHISELNEVGSYKTIDIVNERGFVIKCEKNEIRACFFDHWKSIENIDLSVLKKTKCFCLIHSKEINHPVGSSLNKRVLTALA